MSFRKNKSASRERVLKSQGNVKSLSRSLPKQAIPLPKAKPTWRRNPA